MDYSEIDHYVGTLDDKEHKFEVIKIKSNSKKVERQLDHQKKKVDRPIFLFWSLIFILLFFACLVMLYASIILAKWMT